MEIKVLGSSSKGNCYIIYDGCTTILLDAGVPVKTIMTGIDFLPNTVAGCLVTHSHGDHAKSADKLSRIYGVKVYCSNGCAKAAGISGYIPAEGLKEFRAGTFRVLPFGVEHDAPEPLGFLLKSDFSGEKLLYFTDTYFIRYRFKGVTHILCEANYNLDILREKIDSGAVPKFLGERIMGSHMSIDHLIQMLKANDLSRLKKVYLCHLSDSNSDAESFRRRVQEATGAEVAVC